METFALVRPEHLNHFGNLFGGQLLKWVDEFAWLAANRDLPGLRLVTRGFAGIEFTRQVASGSILRFRIDRVRTGTTSVTYRVDVAGRGPDEPGEREVFTTTVTFVAVGPDGRKTALPRSPNPAAE